MQRRTLLAGIAYAVVGCQARQTERELRIVSTSPSMTEVVFGLGLGEHLVGRSSFCDEPPEVKRVPEVGGFANPSIETIVSMRPSLVIGEQGPAGPALPEALEKLGIATWFPVMDRIADIEAMILTLGERLDRDAPARQMVADIEASLARVQARVGDRPRPRMIFLFDYAPLVVAGPTSFPDELVRFAGGENVVVSGGKYPKLSPESLVLLDPNVIVDGTNGVYVEPPETLIAQIPGASRLTAVRTGRLRRLPGSAALRPGPRIGRGVEELSRLLHPEAEP